MIDESMEKYRHIPTEELLALHRVGNLAERACRAIEHELLRREDSAHASPGSDSADALRGVGGWLLFFIFTYTLSPFFAGGQYYVYHTELKNLTQQFPELNTALHIDLYLSVCALFLAGGSALTFYIVYALLWEKHYAVFLAKLGLALFITNNILIAPLLKLVFFGYTYFSSTGLAGYLLAQAVISIPAFAWYLYFCRSSRVKATYLP